MESDSWSTVPAKSSGGGARKDKIYVGNLPYSMDQAKVTALFSPCGTIKGVNIRRDRRTNKSKGFGFVTFESEDAAAEAVKRFSGHILDDRELTVSWATARGSERRRQRKEEEKSYDWLGKEWNSWSAPTKAMVSHMDSKTSGTTLAQEYHLGDEK